MTPFSYALYWKNDIFHKKIVKMNVFFDKSNACDRINFILYGSFFDHDHRMVLAMVVLKIQWSVMELLFLRFFINDHIAQETPPLLALLLYL